MQHGMVWSLFAAVITVAGCSDAAGPTTEETSGYYVASVFTATTHSETTDILEEDGFIRLVLRQRDSLVGDIIVPPGVIDDEESVKFNGSWRLRGSRIVMDPGTRTFLSQMRFDVVHDELRGVAKLGVTTMSGDGAGAGEVSRAFAVGGRPTVCCFRSCLTAALPRREILGSFFG